MQSLCTFNHGIYIIYTDKISVQIIIYDFKVKSNFEDNGYFWKRWLYLFKYLFKYIKIINLLLCYANIYI